MVFANPGSSRTERVTRTVTLESVQADGTRVEIIREETQPASASAPVEVICFKCFKKPNGSMNCHTIDCPTLTATPRPSN